MTHRIHAGAIALVAATTILGCSTAVVVVPQRQGGYTARDTLRGRLKDRDIRVTFRHDTTWRVDTVVRWRTVYRDGARTDTVVAVVLDTVHRVDTVRIGRPDPRRRVDTVRVVVRDTVVVREPAGPGRPGTPGGPIILPPRPADPGVDTIWVRVRDTVRIVVRDTVRIVVRDTIVRRDTVHLPGRRVLHVPPGHYPPPGQCRIWIMDRPPGQQAEPAACNALGTIPRGAFVLFGGEAWDFDYDWLKDPSAPPEIVALKRPGGARGSAPPAPTTPSRVRRPGAARP